MTKPRSGRPIRGRPAGWPTGWRFVGVAALLALLPHWHPVLAGTLIGETAAYRIESPSETLMDVARRFDLGYVEVRAVNPDIDPWQPRPGAVVLLPLAHLLPDVPPAPARRSLIIINLGDFRLYWLPANGEPTSMPIGSAADPYPEPMGEGHIRGKRVNPVWTPPPTVRAEHPELPRSVGPGPDNPLGAFALDMSWPAYAVHGTNKPDGVGRRVSHGCIRLYPEDIARLFPQVGIGTRVVMVDQPVKLGWIDGELYLEAHPDRDQADEIERNGTFVPHLSAQSTMDTRLWIARLAGDAVDRVDWGLVDDILSSRNGLPVPILKSPDTAAGAEQSPP
ncbi:L,D-transpeptidase ErfK/SrfK [Nitrospirillum viridazoti]|uniref:L,D-TPase catalytic domain-containing protein n=1 Tax=Nitrospirillum viridazoti CBAmc TaxID=1441467 RepID=A0A248K0L2_9PROT|nr:hypothetical protein Y958_26790 [Nitrospirillum amazonense CBAmc]TWB37174.1 L,D-transpeptidase ErfK/SrfK [Nitrospirillum amazonense]